jgi:hypothetical protein
MIRTQCVALAAVAAAVVSSPAPASAQGLREDYARAERFLNDEIRKLAFDGQVDPHWMAGTSRFWYLKDAPDGKEFLIVDAAQGSRGPAFDHQRLATAASRVMPFTGQRYDARALPFSFVRFVEPGRIAFVIDRTGLTCDLSAYTCARSIDMDEEEDEVRGGPPRQPDPPRLPRTERPSPDRTLVAFVRDHNLWIRNAATGEQIQLSRDGEHFYDYATPLPSPTLMVAQGTEDVVQAPAVFWSPDSKKIATYVMDQRNFPRLTITQSAPPDQFRPKYFSYAYPGAGHRLRSKYQTSR